MMWKLVDCGTYPWFVRETKKYFYCVYGVTGETKKLKVKRTEMPMYYNVIKQPIDMYRLRKKHSKFP